MEPAGTDWRRTLKAPGWFRSVPVEFPCMVPLYVIERKEWFHWFRYLNPKRAGGQLHEMLKGSSHTSACVAEITL
jgi:hypothetical protein